MIYPKTYPLNEYNAYEKEVFESLQKFANNNPDYDIFFGRKFSGTALGEKIEYEIDFLIADLRNGKFNGLCIVEVKGNQLKYDGARNEWIQDGRIMNVSPTSQARKNMGSLMKRFPELSNTTCLGWAVWFPRMINPGPTLLPTELSDYQYFDELCLNYTKEKIESFFTEIKGQWTNKRGGHLQDYLRFKESLIRDLGYVLPLHKQIEASNARFLEMTARQLELIKLVARNNDVLVTGPAGSGKTVMATTIAKQLAEQGKSVLLVTYNRALANNIRYGFGRVENPEVSTYHSIARKILDENFEGWWQENSKSEDFWILDIPIKLLDVPKENLPKYDFIIIDEAQDLKEEWYETIENLIKPDGGFYIFLDEDQDIFQAYTKINISRRLFEFPLEENCRNTVEIIKQLKEYIGKDIKHPLSSVQGDSIKLIEYSNDTEQMNKLKREWLYLVEEQQIKPEQIVLMMNAHKRESCLAKTTKFGKYKIQSVDRSGRLNNRAVNYTSINTFKGLEADIVMIIDTDKPQHPSPKMLYTQASRAKNILYITKIK